MAGPSLESDDVLGQFVPGLEALRSISWFVQNYVTVLCLFGFLLAALLLYRGRVVAAMVALFFALTMGATPKIASLFYYH